MSNLYPLPEHFISAFSGKIHGQFYLYLYGWVRGVWLGKGRVGEGRGGGGEGN